MPLDSIYRVQTQDTVSVLWNAASNKEAIRTLGFLMHAPDSTKLGLTRMIQTIRFHCRTSHLLDLSKIYICVVIDRYDYDDVRYLDALQP